MCCTPSGVQSSLRFARAARAAAGAQSRLRPVLRRAENLEVTAAHKKAGSRVKPGTGKCGRNPVRQMNGLIQATVERLFSLTFLYQFSCKNYSLEKQREIISRLSIIIVLSCVSGAGGLACDKVLRPPLPR